MARFITIEGGDGSGKSTLIAHIKEALTKRNTPFLLTREPGGTPVGDEIRESLMKPDRKLCALTELFLYEAARAEHVTSVIKPALRSGTTVICDRFTHSTLAYQGYARGLGIALVNQLNDLACQNVQPDAVIWLKVSPAVAQERMKNRGELTGFDNETSSFHQKIFQAFEEIAQKEASRFIVLDAHKPPASVAQELLSSPRWHELFP